MTLSKIMLKVFVILSMTFTMNKGASAQQVVLNVNNQPLSEVLLSLSDTYGIQLSFNHSLMNKCLVNSALTFDNPDQAIDFLTTQCGLTYEFSDGVYIIFQAEEAAADTNLKITKYYYSGQLLDEYSKEPLPYSSIQLDDFSLTADASGNFAFNTAQELKHLQISHLGYYVLDTALIHGQNQVIKLTPSVIGLQEVIVNTNAKVYTAYIGERPGLIKVNKKVASFLPGNNNNTLFNLLRLQPGILATAEQSGDYIIWGSYRGQTLLQYDGIPLFSANSLNNEIGVVNPLIVSDVEVHKAGYSVDKGDRVGGIIEMTGTTGDFEEFKSNVNLNSQTVSGSINIPIASKFALQAAFRQTYYSVIDWDDVVNDNENASYFVPEYHFQDLNIKFSGKLNNGDNFYISLLGNNDNSSFNVEEASKYKGRAWENTIDKQQLGIAANYKKKWSAAGVSDLTLALSDLTTSTFDRLNPNRSTNAYKSFFKTFYRENTVNEWSAKLKHDFAASGINQFTIGANIINNRIGFAEDTITIKDLEENSSAQFSLYVKDQITLGSYVTINPGLKMDVLPAIDKIFWLPRISAHIKPRDNWTINLAWGLYNQYITEIALLDDLGNRYYYWGISDGNRLPVVTAQHNVAGLSFKHKGYKIGSEGFYKTTNGLSHLPPSGNNNGYWVVNGVSRVYGMDFYAQKSILNHDFWVSYTLSRSEEKFGKQNPDYQLAPQDQTHELKLAGILNFNAWHFSVNYVYGSGLASSQGIQGTGVAPYHRLDAAFLYKFKTKTFDLETGLSLVNVLNYKNVGLTNFTKLPENKTTYARGVPFTPSVFINIAF